MNTILKHKPFKILFRQEGFALVTAVIACAMLLALGILVIYLSTQDLRTSGRVVGEKKALASVDSGIHNLVLNFNPLTYTTDTFYNQWYQVDAINDPNSKYSIGTPTMLSPPTFPLTGYSLEVGQGWGMTRYSVQVTGQNSNYASSVQVTSGIGYGPIPTGTLYR
jgi:hypothetical protein